MLEGEKNTLKLLNEKMYINFNTGYRFDKNIKDD